MLQQSLSFLFLLWLIRASLGTQAFFYPYSPFYYYQQHPQLEFARGFYDKPSDSSFPRPYASFNVRQTTSRPRGYFSTTTAQTPQYQACLRRCPATPQYDPVCGSNGQSYNNRYYLNCARKCGVSVRLVRIGLCAPRLPSIA